MKGSFTFIALLFCVSTLASELEVERDPKVFSLFSIVHFPNEGCSSSKDNGRNGTCFTASECSDKGGAAYGNCAAG